MRWFVLQDSWRPLSSFHRFLAFHREMIQGVCSPPETLQVKVGPAPLKNGSESQDRSCEEPRGLKELAEMGKASLLHTDGSLMV